MTTGSTGVAQLSNVVHTKYQKDYMVAAAKADVWGQLVDWQEPVQEGDGGSSFTYFGFNEMDDDDVSARLPESTDIDATQLDDWSVTVTPYEYGRRAQLTRLVRFQSSVNVRQACAGIVGRNMANTVQKAIRRGVLGGSYTLMPNGNTARTGLDATNDKVSWAFLTQLASLAASMEIEPIDSEGNVVAIIHPALEPDILALLDSAKIGYQMDKEAILRGEIGKLAGFRFVKSPYGKLYLSGGTTAQTATTLSAAVAAGGTSITVTTATGIAAGDILTLGTLEAADAEQVLVVSGTNPYTVRGIGNGGTNTGVKWAHAAGAAVTEAANVAGIAVVGRNSIKGVYGADTGRYGKSVVKEGTDSLGRIVSQGWLWYGGIGIVTNKVLRGECAISSYIYGPN